MSGGHVRYTKELQDTFRLLMKLFGSTGCRLYKVRRSKRWPRSSFLAVPQLRPEQSVLVRPTSNEKVTVAPLSILSEVKSVQDWCNTHPTPLPVVWLEEPLMRWGKFSGWQQFLSEESIEEWRLLSQEYA